MKKELFNRENKILTFANLISLSRIFLSIPLVYFLNINQISKALFVIILIIVTDLIDESQANQVVWARTYLPPVNNRDTQIKSLLKQKGLLVKSFPGHLLFEPWSVSPKSSEFFKVYTPFWKATRLKDPVGYETKVSEITSINEKLYSERLEDWHLGKEMSRGSCVVRRFVRLGEDAARERLGHFISNNVMNYSTSRDIPSVDGTSGLSEN